MTQVADEKQENSHPPLFFLLIYAEKKKKSRNMFVYSKISSTFALAMRRLVALAENKVNFISSLT